MAVPNPWSADNWNLTDQGAYIKKYGLSVAQRTARLAGSAIGALRPHQDQRIIERHWILQKKIGSVGGGGQGSSGSGAPSP